MRSRKINIVLFTVILCATMYFLAQDYIYTKDMDATGENVDYVNEEIETGINIGQQAPNFKLKDLSGNEFELESFRGKTVMLNFWSMTCPPCLEEMPYMQEVYDEYKNREFEIVAVNLDKNMKEVELFIDHFEYDFLVLEGNENIARTYMVRFIPKTLFLDPEGLVYYEHVGAMDRHQIVEKIEEISSR